MKIAPTAKKLVIAHTIPIGSCFRMDKVIFMRVAPTDRDEGPNYVPAVSLETGVFTSIPQETDVEPLDCIVHIIGESIKS